MYIHKEKLQYLAQELYFAFQRNNHYKIALKVNGIFGIAINHQVYVTDYEILVQIT